MEVANGDGPRDHEAIKDLKLPPLGQPTRDMPLLTRTLLFVAQGDPIMIRTPPGGGNNGNRIRAYDKKTGAVIWDFKLPAGTTGAIMTYTAQGQAVHRRADRLDELPGRVRRLQPAVGVSA